MVGASRLFWLHQHDTVIQRIGLHSTCLVAIADDRAFIQFIGSHTPENLIPLSLIGVTVSHLMEQPMEDDEIVQTSDVEEREAIDAGSSLYWPSSPLVHQRGAHTHGTLAMVALSTPLSKSVVRIPEHMLEPPRKRRRVRC